MSKRNARWSEEVFVAEGADLVAAALATAAGVESCFVSGDAIGDPTIAQLIDRATKAGTRVYELDRAVFEKVADTVTPQPIMAVVPMVHVPLSELVDGLVVVLADVRDPGNAGTLVRSADASGATGVVVCEGSVDLYNPKTVRSTAGSLFHVPVACGRTPADVLEECRARGWRLLGTDTDGTDYLGIDWRVPSALVLGNEASGLDESLLDRCDERVAVPMAGQAESLNVSVAGSVICFEALAQRRLGPRTPASTMHDVSARTEHD